MVAETTRSLDEGGPFLLQAPALEPGEPLCGHGVVVETRFEPRADAAGDTITLLLRRAERGEGVAVRAYGEPVMATLSLATGRCVPVDEDAARLVREHAWLGGALAERLDWLRDRARRAIAQRDRESSCQGALHGAEPGSMTPYDKLFPADWDLLIQHDGIPIGPSINTA
jgi:hypothetical protein